MRTKVVAKVFVLLTLSIGFFACCDDKMTSHGDFDLAVEKGNFQAMGEIIDGVLAKQHKRDWKANVNALVSWLKKEPSVQNVVFTIVRTNPPCAHIDFTLQIDEEDFRPAACIQFEERTGKVWLVRFTQNYGPDGDTFYFNSEMSDSWRGAQIEADTTN